MLLAISNNLTTIIVTLVTVLISGSGYLFFAKLIDTKAANLEAIKKLYRGDLESQLAKCEARLEVLEKNHENLLVRSAACEAREKLYLDRIDGLNTQIESLYKRIDILEKLLKIEKQK